jgi:uncharacterized protein YcaQ
MTHPRYPKVTLTRLRAYRARTFRLAPGLQVKTPRQALAFVEERGFVFFWAIQGIDLPSLWTAVAGNRRVASEHDDPGHVTWGWKDSLLSQRRWFYAKLLRGKSMMVSLKTLPYFYALSDRLGDLEDYQLAYEAGRLSREARAIADALRINGAQHTVALRKLAHLSSQASKRRFDKGLHDLQRGLWVLPVGVAEAGAWRYAFIYELLDRWLPDIARQARRIRQDTARQHLAGLYLDSVGAAEAPAIRSMFRWSGADVDAALQALSSRGTAAQLEDGRWVSGLLLAGPGRRPRA